LETNRAGFGGTALVTIVAKNRLAHARVLMNSVRETDPDFSRIVLLIDDPEDLFNPAKEPFTIVSSERLGIARSRWFHFKYSILELSTALKPFFLHWLLCDQGFERIIYLDPDVRVYSSLTGLEAALEVSNIVLTPHLTAPLNDDCQPSELQILRAGAYNLGFIGVRAAPETERFLRWWESHLYEFCVVDLLRGLFVDQRWIDLVPGMFSGVSILRDSGYNAAYWNADAREIVERDGSLLVGNQPLYFFHFSGYDPLHPDLISRHQDRLRLPNRPDLAALCEQYRTELFRQGFPVCVHWPYTHGRFRNGCVIPDVGRHLLDEAPELPSDVEDPFSDEGYDRIVRFWNEPVSRNGHPGVTRLAYRVYRLSADVQAAMPDVFGADYLGFLRWMLSKAPHEHLLSEPFLRGVRASAFEKDLSDQPVPNSEVEIATSGPPLDRLTIKEKNSGPRTSEDGNETTSSSPLTALSRYIYESRPDLQRVFPDPGGRHKAAYLAWLLYYGRGTYALSDECLAPIRDSLNSIQKDLPFSHRASLAMYSRALRLGVKLRPLVAAARKRSISIRRSPKAENRPKDSELATLTPPQRGLGVNVYGYFRAETGVGQSARNGISALTAAGIPTALRNLSAEGHNEHDSSIRSFSADAPYDTSIFFVNADQTHIAHRGLHRSSSSRSIGVWTWELEELPPQWNRAFENYDEIWVPSSFCQAAIGAHSPLPVVRIPYCVQPAKDNGFTREDFIIDPGRFVFLNIVDMRSGFARKNALGTMRAFQVAFRGNRDVELVIKVNHAASSHDGLCQLRREASENNTRLIESALRHEDVTALIRCCDCVASLHRAEGFGLVLAEAMWLGKPVIATAYSGNLDFTTLDNAFLVPFEMRPVGPGNAPYPESARWADPIIERAAEQMKLVYQNAALRAERAAAGRKFVQSRFSPETVGSVMAARLELLRSRGSGRMAIDGARSAASGASR
jgi:glycosyltransferase involved in cell wall biosynthesis